MRLCIIGLLAILSFISCVSEFAPEVRGVSGILVVDGTITNGDPVFRLSRSVDISADLLRDKEVITEAKMYVERDDGALFPATHEGEGVYRVLVGDLEAGMEYRLCFSRGNKEYQSEFLRPIQTAEIDSLSYKERKGTHVAVYLTSDGRSGNSLYYRWGYRETWEVTASIWAKQYYEDGALVVSDRLSPRNHYYCWGRDTSKSLLLGTTKELSENLMLDRLLYEIPRTDEKLSVLYHVEVSQMQLRQEAYAYYLRMQEEIERTGGLFCKVMTASDDHGNIRCASDPQEPVIGYVEVATVTTKGLYIADGSLYESAEKACWVFESVSQDYQLPWVDYDKRTYSSWRCVDCREHYNATKNKPSWWPTDHL